MVGDWPNDRLWPLWAMLRDTAPELIHVGRDAGVEDLAITGSVARGVDHNASDFDFWLPTVERGRLDKYTDQEALKSEFSRVLGRSVDIRPLVPNVDDPIYSETQVATLYNVSVKTLQAWRVTGKGPQFLKLGKGLRAAVRYRRSDLLRYLSDCVRSSTSEHSAEAK